MRAAIDLLPLLDGDIPTPEIEDYRSCQRPRQLCELPSLALDTPGGRGSRALYVAHRG